MTVQPVFSLVNGQADATISVADRGLAFGDGVVETLLFRKGTVPFLIRHLERLCLGLNRLRIECSRDTVERQLEQLNMLTREHTLPDGTVKIIVTRGQGRGYAPQQQSPTIITSLYPAPSPNNLAREGVTITACRQRLTYQPALLGIKHLNRLDNVLAAQEINDRNYVEGLMVDDQGNVAEAVSRNLFIVKNDSLLTPDLSRGGIAGVARAVIMEELANTVGVKCKASVISLSEVMAADEVFLCNSITGVWPVVAIDNTPFTIGPLTQQIQQAWTQLLQNFSAVSTSS